MIDYTILYKCEMPLKPWTSLKWDLFVSAYDGSDRVKATYSYAVAKRKHWLNLPQYRFDKRHLPPKTLSYTGETEADYVTQYENELVRQGVDVSSERVCIDITGFVAPHLLFLIKLLFMRGCKRFEVLYAEPSLYAQKEETKFFEQEPESVRQVEGFEGKHQTDTSNDLLIIGVGYDHRAVMYTAEFKPHAQKHLIYGLPSLQPDMYQENVLRVQRAAESVGSVFEDDGRIHYAPANNPFATAQTIREIIRLASKRKPPSNIYLAPLATKAQALGFGLYWLIEGQDSPISVLFPVVKKYAINTSKGITRVWRYVVEFPRDGKGGDA